MPVVVLIDTNIWVSALINPRGHPAQVVNAWLDGRFDVVLSLPLLQELVEVLHRPRIRHKRHIAEQDVQRLIDLLSEQAIRVELQGNLRLCRDPDDDLVVETAVLGQARYAITRDDDLKADADLVKQMQARGIIVLSVGQFLRLVETGVL